MSAPDLFNRLVRDTYGDLLQVYNPDVANTGVDTTLRSVRDGRGQASALMLSTAAARVDGLMVAAGFTTVPGAVGDGITDDTAAIQAALDLGGLVLLDAGTFLISNTLTIAHPTWLMGTGGATVLRPSATFDTGADVIKLVRGGFTETPYFWKLSSFQIRPAADNVARHGIEIDLTTAGLAQVVVEDIDIGEVVAYSPLSVVGPSGYAVHITTGSGSITTCSFNRVRFKSSGMYLPGVSDSFWITNFEIAGRGRGIYLEPVSGAFEAVLRNGNIINTQGSVHIKTEGQTTIESVQMEMLNDWGGAEAAGADYRALVVFENSNRNRVVNCNLNPVITGASNGCDCIQFLGTSKDNRVEKSRLVTKSADSHVHARSASGATGNYVAPNCRFENPYNTEVVAAVVSDASTVMKGVWQGPVSLSSSWVAQSTGGSMHEGLYYRINDDRTVSLRGQLAGGTNATGTTIATLPAGARPQKDKRIKVGFYNAGTTSFGVWLLVAYSSGPIKIETAVMPAVTTVSFDEIRFDIG